MGGITESDIESFALEGPEDQGFQCCYGPSIAHDGASETERLPNWRRLERILICHKTETFLVMLEDRGDHILPRTACLVEYSNRQRKLIAEYEACIKAEAAQRN